MRNLLLRTLLRSTIALKTRNHDSEGVYLGKIGYIALAGMKASENAT